MVARINTGKSISKVLNYNEQKIQQGKADILFASGFIKDADKLNFYDKLGHFERYISLNERATTNTLHVSLNFHPSEKLSGERFVSIAEVYMNKIGFGHQPYLVYSHHDAGHPHIHIVSINIERDGKRISMHRLGAIQSEKARKEIEIEYNLVKAESKNSVGILDLIPKNAQKIKYGKSETKRAISNVLAVVLNQYKYTSLPELNAVLKLYNVTADRGSENSRMYKQNGLVYRVLVEAGNKTGTPIKASAFYMKPTMGFLETKFQENESLRSPYKSRLQTSISWVLNKKPVSLHDFVKALEKENISTILRIGKEGIVYGITYIDHKTKSVFNGSDLGRTYSAKAILEKCQPANSQTSQISTHEKERLTDATDSSKQLIKKGPDKHQPAEILPEHKTSQELNYVPFQLKKKKKKKRKRLIL